jgi:bidirectional [NiFe] hydrogenase diaphorase subunit
MSEIKLNGRKMRAEAGQTVLDVARQNGFYIPTLCYHPGLGAYGACRLCLVEVKAGFRPGLASSCSLPATDGLEAETDSPDVLEARRLVAELLLARAPESKEIRAIAASLGVESTDIPRKSELCILCGRCVRACKALGVNAISFVQRGGKRRVAVPFFKPSEACIACQACVAVCPTGAIRAMITPQAVEIVEWQAHQTLERCAGCGKPFVTKGQRTRVEQVVDPNGLHGGDLCPRCRRIKMAGLVVSIPQESSIRSPTRKGWL